MVWLAGGAAAAGAADPATGAAEAPAVRAPETGLDGYRDALRAELAALRASVDAMVPSAEAAAARYLEEDGGISVWGLADFEGEARGRSGGIIRMRRASKQPTAVVLAAVDEPLLAERGETLREIAGAPDRVVMLFGTPAALAEADRLGIDADHAVTLPSPGAGGATAPAVRLAALWAWTGEFAAACTRQGRMPVFYQGHAVHGGADRTRRVARLRFHEEEPVPVPPRTKGREYLRELGKDVDLLFARETDDLRAVARAALAAERAGHRSYVFLHGHLFNAPLADAPRPDGPLEPMNCGWFEPREDVDLEPGDFVFCVGFDRVFSSWKFDGWAEKARAEGAVLAWSFSGYLEDEVAAVPPGELFVDQLWDFGDAVVLLPGYDVPILPTGGALAAVVLDAVRAEYARAAAAAGVSAAQ